jgi:hypothetical protein
MAKFYGMVQGDRGAETRCGQRRIKSACQSYRGSVITELTYKDNDLMVEVRIGENESTSYGSLLWYGTFEEFVVQMKK